MKKFILAAVLAAVAVAPSGAQQAWQVKKWTPKLIVATTSGSTPDYAHSVTIITSADFSGTIDGQAVTGAAPGGAFSWTGHDDHPLNPISYTRSAGTLYILYTK